MADFSERGKLRESLNGEISDPPSLIIQTTINLMSHL